MRLPARPSVPMMVLRSVATVLISAIIAQVGWAAAALGGEPHYWRNHAVGAPITLGLCVAAAAVYVVMRRSAGPINVGLAVGLAVAVAAQYGLGEAHVIGWHVFLGTLIAMLVTALTSWTYRHDDRAPRRPREPRRPGEPGEHQGQERP